jgi:patatin-like phospholipase/acyl hydrolase
VLVLTLDGGGMRGLFEAHVLVALERALGRRLPEVFDLVAGTSTGGVLALGITVAGRSPAELVTLYEEHGPKIFRRTPLARARQLLVSKYRRTQLDETLQIELGDTRLSSAAPRTIVPAFSLARRDLVWFDSD